MTDTEQVALDASHVLHIIPSAIYLQRWSGDGTAFQLVSSNVEKIMGYPPSAWLNQPEFWNAHVHPEDLCEAVETKNKLRSQRKVSLEYRFRHGSGHYIWIEDMAELICDSQGEAVAAHGVWVDVSAKRKSENRLRVLDQVLDQSREGIMVTDAFMRITCVNRAFTQITGYAPDEAIGMTPSFLKSGLQDEKFYASMWESIRKEGHWEGELWNRNKQGALFPEWLSVSAILNDKGQATEYLGIFRDLSGQKATDDFIHRLANYDALTGLPNRTLFTDRAHTALSAAQQTEESAAVMHINLDHFCGVNESLGHETGDLVLTEVAQRLAQDVRPDDTISRMGADNFLVLLPCSSTRDVASIANRLMASVAKPMHVEGHDITITASVGIATFPTDGTNLLELTQSAECAVHQAKRSGRQQLQFASKSLQEELVHAMHMEMNLRHALERNQFVLHYQPQVDIKTGCITGMEALVRWVHPEWGVVSPAKFIPIAEDFGLIRDIGKWVLRAAVAQNAAWLKQGTAHVPIAVNLSANQFSDRGLFDYVSAVLDEFKLPPRLLELEVTESSAMVESALTIETIERLKQLGVQLSIDDFGTGYSSLARLKSLAFNKLKIDQSFVREVCADPTDAMIVRTVVGLAQSIGMTTVAEGVETPEQLECLRSLGCDEYQGFLFSRALPANQIEGIVRNRSTTPHAERCFERDLKATPETKLMN